MAIYDLVGVPFPYHHPNFSSDTKLLKNVKRLEHLCEIADDLRNAIEALEALRYLYDTKLNQFTTTLAEAAVTHAVLLYARLYRQTKGKRLTLDHKSVLRNASEKILNTHQFIENIVNQFFAHAELRINAHQLFMLPNRNLEKSPHCNSCAQRTRRILSKSHIWNDAIELFQFTHTHIVTLIEKQEKSIENSLSEEQIKVLNLTPKSEMLDKYWVVNNRSLQRPW